MKKLVILILVLITTICFSENTKSVFDSKGPWTLDTTYQSEDHKIIFKGNVFKEINSLEYPLITRREGTSIRTESKNHAYACRLRQSCKSIR